MDPDDNACNAVQYFDRDQASRVVRECVKDCSNRKKDIESPFKLSELTGKDGRGCEQ